MPSIFIGNSTISGNAFSLTGPTGNTGPRGITGNVGLIGITGGPTGSTGIYIKNVVKTDAGFLFSMFGGTTIGPISGFTGPNILYYSSKGISAAFGTDYSSVFLYATGGMTFAFRGICGGNEYVTTSMSSDGREVLVTVQNLPSGSVLYGISTDNFLAYTNSSYTATKTKIKIENQTTEDDTSSFKSSTNFGTLNFGLTANAVSNKINDVETYLDSTHPFLPISSLNRSFNPVSVLKTNGIRSIDSGGYVLDMNKASVFKISTPVGITSFYVDTNTPQKLKTWLFFIEGSDVWNFPQNVYFENGITGIQNYAFSSGMNILRIESDPINNNSFYASFVDRFFGDSGVGIKYGGIGSCCKTDGTCEDYTTQSVCTDVYRGVFTPLASCANTCDVGSCCINGTCYDTVQRSVCAAAGGVFGSSSCSVRGPCNLVYTVETVDPPVSSTIIEYSNSASIANPQTIATFNVKTNQANSKVEIPNAINDSLGVIQREFFIKDHVGVRDVFGVYTISTPNLNPGLTFTLQFNNTEDAIMPGTVYTPTPFTVKLKDSSGVDKSSLIYNLKPSAINTCAGVPNSVLIKTHYFANRYCRDCYNKLYSRRTYYPVQKQNGSFDFCVNLTKNEEGKYVTTPVCTVTSDVEHVNDCKITALNAESIMGEDVAKQCPHIDHQFNPANCNAPCNTAVPVTAYSGPGSGSQIDVDSCKGISLENQTRYPYWHEVSIENTSQLQNDLVRAGVTLSQDIDYIMSSIKNSISDSLNPDNNLQVLFNSTNQGKGITFVSNPAYASCCPADVITSPSGASSCLDFTGSATSKPRFFVIYTATVDSMYCSGDGGVPRQVQRCSFRTSTKYTYAIIIKAWFTVATDGTVTDFIDATKPGCVVDIICTRREAERSCGSGGSSTCAAVSCISEHDNEYSIDRISEIKVSNTTGAGSCRKLILTKTEYDQDACSGTGTKSFRIDINETTNWYSSSQQYALIEQQLYELFWYPLFCSDCDGSVTACTNSDCLNLCFGNGSPYSSSITSSNVRCTLQPSVNRIIIIEKTISGTDTILTPRIYGRGTSGLEEKTNESVYYVLGQPTDPLDVNTLYRDSCNNPNNTYKFFNLPRILSGTPVQIKSNLLETNEFTVYYTNGQQKEFYEWYAYPCDGGDTRNSPVRIVKKHKESTSFLPGIDFNCDIRANGDDFTINITTKCGENNPSCIDAELDTSLQKYFIKNTKWQIVEMQSNVWYEYKDKATDTDENAKIVNYTDDVTTFAPEYYISSIYDMNSEYVLNKNRFPTTGYSTPGKINMFISVRANLYYEPVGYRLVEKTKVISIDRNTLRLSLTSSGSRNTKYKLITDEETGKSQCVLMDCSVTTDCNTLPDC